jgi:hypothetical protein
MNFKVETQTFQSLLCPSLFYHAFTNPEYVGERRAERREQQHHGLQETLLVQALVGSIWDACATTWRKLLAAPLHVQPVRAPQKFRQPCGGILRWSESPVVYSDGQSHPWPNIQHHYITSYHMLGLCALSDQCHRDCTLVQKPWLLVYTACKASVCACTFERTC